MWARQAAVMITRVVIAVVMVIAKFLSQCQVKSKSEFVRQRVVTAEQSWRFGCGNIERVTTAACMLYSYDLT